jgi:hypothetical protein
LLSKNGERVDVHMPAQGDLEPSQHSGGVWGAQQQLPAIVASVAFKESGGWAQHVGSFRKPQGCQSLAEEFGHPAGLLANPFESGISHEQTGQSAEGWIAMFASKGQFACKKAGIVVAGGSLDDIVVGAIALYDHASPAFAAAGPAGDLCQQLKGSFAAAKIG